MAEIILALRPPSPVADGRRASRHSNHRSGALFRRRRRRRGVAAAPASRERLSARPEHFRQSMPRTLISRVGTGSSQGMRPIGDGRSEFQFDQNRIRRTRAAPGSAQPLPLDASVRAANTPPSNRAIGCNRLQSAWPIPSRQASDTAQHALGLATRVSYVRAVGARTRNQAQNNRAPTDPRGKLYLNGLITI